MAPERDFTNAKTATQCCEASAPDRQFIHVGFSIEGNGLRERVDLNFGLEEKGECAKDLARQRAVFRLASALGVRILPVLLDTPPGAPVNQACACDFPWAMGRVAAGCSVARSGWSMHAHLRLRGPMVIFSTDNLQGDEGDFFNPSIDDINAVDWCMYQPAPRR